MIDAIDNLKNRRSIRKYKAQCPTEAEIKTVVEAGCCAPSGMNQQSAVIVAVTNKEDMDTLRALNARVRMQEGDPLYGAPAALEVLYRTDSSFGIQDGSLVMGNLMNAAHAIGLGSCWINRFNKVFELPEGKALLEKWGVEGEYTGLAACIIGYPDEERKMSPRKENYIYYAK